MLLMVIYYKFDYNNHNNLWKGREIYGNYEYI